MRNMKFEMPNDYGIYLHDTPHQELFAEADRHLSNGCVRLEDYRRFATWVFGHVPQATSPCEQRFNLPRPVPVYMTYLTVAADGQWRHLPPRSLWLRRSGDAADVFDAKPAGFGDLAQPHAAQTRPLVDAALRNGAAAPWSARTIRGGDYEALGFDRRLALVLAASAPAMAQDKADKDDKPAKVETSCRRSDSTRLSGVFGGQKISYTRDHRRDDPVAEDGTQKAAIVTTSYVKEPRDPSRPVTFLFNGGPGSGSVWLQMGAFGPKRVAIPSDARDDGAPPYPIARQSRQPARRHRPRLHRPAGHRLLPPDRQDRAQGILRRHRRRQGGGARSSAAGSTTMAAGTAPIPRRRKLWHDPLGRGGQRAGEFDLQRCRPERRHPDLDGARFRRRRGHARQ